MMTGNTLIENLQPRFASGNIPDVFSYELDDFSQEQGDRGARSPTSATPGPGSEMVPAMQAAWTYNGVKYGISGGVCTTLIFYNMDYFKKAGITALPKNWDEFLAACEKLKAGRHRAPGLVRRVPQHALQWPAQLGLSRTTCSERARRPQEPGHHEVRLLQESRLARDLREDGYPRQEGLPHEWVHLHRLRPGTGVLQQGRRGDALRRHLAGLVRHRQGQLPDRPLPPAVERRGQGARDRERIRDRLVRRQDRQREAGQAAPGLHVRGQLGHLSESPRDASRRSRPRKATSSTRSSPPRWWS